MDAIGNDIVDLKTIDAARTRTPRFYQKILADTEQQLYHSCFSSLPLEHFVWLLWSVKEAAYKCLQRHQPALSFSPVGIVTTFLEPPLKQALFPGEHKVGTGFDNAVCFRAGISFYSQKLYAYTIIHPNAVIHSVASFNPDFSNVSWGIKEVPQSTPEKQSEEVRIFLLQDRLLQNNGNNYQVEKNSYAQPFISADAVETGINISISHHGTWLAYALCL